MQPSCARLGDGIVMATSLNVMPRGQADAQNASKGSTISPTYTSALRSDPGLTDQDLGLNAWFPYNQMSMLLNICRYSVKHKQRSELCILPYHMTASSQDSDTDLVHGTIDTCT